MIKRVEPKDAKKVSAFLRRVFEEDSLSGGDPSIQAEDAVKARCEVTPMHYCIEDGKVMGVLQGFSGGIIELWDKWYTFQYYNLLAVDHHLYVTSRSDAVRIARELSLAAVNELRAPSLLPADDPRYKKMPDFIVVEGPTNSRGASWCRILGMSEEFRGDWSWFIQPFDVTCERLKEMEKL